MPSRKKRKEAEKSIKLFPWVADNWTCLEEEQKRQKSRLARLAPNTGSSTASILKGICTMYGDQPGTFCKICHVIHPKRHKNLLDKEEEDTSGFVTRAGLKLKADRKRQKKILQKECKTKQIARMKYAVSALRHRRRTREKKMKVPKDSFLQDFTDTGGSAVTKEMNDAIDNSFKNQGYSRKESRFKGRIKTKGSLLKFPKIAYANDYHDQIEEEERIAKMDQQQIQQKKRRLLNKAEKWRRGREASSGRNIQKKKMNNKVIEEDTKLRTTWEQCTIRLKQLFIRNRTENSQ